MFTNFFEGEFWQAFLLSNKFAFTVVIIQLFLSLVLAIVLNENIRGKRVLRSVLLMPWVIPTAVTALLWMWLYQPDYGVLNYILKTLGLKQSLWLGSVDTALTSVMIVAIWKQMPFTTTMLIAGMQSISHDYYEASSIDGANKLQNYYYITIPFLKNVIKSTTLVSIIENFKMFPLFWIMTQGGPINATTTLAVLTYQTSFVSMDMGKGATIGVLWIIFLVVFSRLFNSVFKEESFV
ncbi:MAG: sugar ABC transporter permease [Clostridiaceae bacterium]|nr:sugar ABC transporter permease [Clostridiaceae bacterium]